MPSPEPSEDGSPEAPSTFWGRVKAFYSENIGLFFVFLAQMFASIVRPLLWHRPTPFTCHSTC